MLRLAKERRINYRVVCVCVNEGFSFSLKLLSISHPDILSSPLVVVEFCLVFFLKTNAPNVRQSV